MHLFTQQDIAKGETMNPRDYVEPKPAPKAEDIEVLGYVTWTTAPKFLFFYNQERLEHMAYFMAKTQDLDTVHTEQIARALDKIKRSCLLGAVSSIVSNINNGMDLEDAVYMHLGYCHAEGWTR